MLLSVETFFVVMIIPYAVLWAPSNTPRELKKYCTCNAFNAMT